MKTRFKQIFIEISSRCNLSCPFCPGTKRPTEFMSLEFFEKILSDAHGLTEQIYLHVMGEPLLHPMFSEIVGIASAKSMPVLITTNGTLLDSPAGEALLSPIVRQVNISLHSIKPGIEGEKRLDTIFNFTKKAFEKNPPLYINYRLWNLHDPAESLNGGDNEWICRKIAEAFSVEVPFEGHSAFCKGRLLLKRLYLHLDTSFKWPQLNDGTAEKERGFCYGLNNQIAILSDGTVVPCCLDRDGIMDLGNCKEIPLGEIIGSNRAEKIINGFEDGKRVEALCKVCEYASRFKKKARRFNNISKDL